MTLAHLHLKYIGTFYFNMWSSAGHPRMRWCILGLGWTRLRQVNKLPVFHYVFLMSTRVSQSSERTAWLPLSLAHSNITCTVSGAHTFTPCLTQPLCERDVLIPAWLTLTVWTCRRFRRLLMNLLPTFGETKPSCFLQFFFYFIFFSNRTIQWHGQPGINVCVF